MVCIIRTRDYLYFLLVFSGPGSVRRLRRFPDGGGGIALIASGPVGLVIGAAIGLIAMFVSRPALDKLTRPLMRQMNIPKLLRKTANEQRLLSDSNQKKMAQTIRDALAEDEALQVGLCTQIGQCIDGAILRLTEEKGMAVV